MSITLSSYTLVDPSCYEIGYYVPSYVSRAANGLPRPYALDESPILEFTLTWENNLIHADRLELVNAFYNICAASQTFIDSLSDTYSVMRHPDQKTITFKLVRGYNADNADFLWSTTVKLIEAIS